jgi:hypothetical protein
MRDNRHVRYENKILSLEVQNDYLIYNLNAKSEEIEKLRNLVWLYQTGILKRTNENI